MQPRDLADQRLVLRISGDFVLRWAELVVHLFLDDHLFALVFNTVLRLNVEPILKDPELNLRYAGLEPPPDRLRKPVTISQAARELAMPPATVGRYFKRMASDGGFVRMGRAGYIVPMGKLVRSDALAMTDPNYQNALLLMRRLRKAGFAAPAPDGPLAGRSERYRLVLRLAGEFISGWMRPWSHHYPTGFLYGLIFAAILQANDSDEMASLADSARVPISAYAVAASLGLPTETVRRYVQRLEADGLLLRSPNGYIVPIAAFETVTGRALLTNAETTIRSVDEAMVSARVDIGA